MLLRKYSGCHLIYFSIIKDIKPAARGPTLFFPFSSSSLHFSSRAPARPRLLSFSLSFFPAAGDGDKSEKKIQTASMVGRRDAIFRLPGDKNLINDRVVLKFKKGAASSLNSDEKLPRRIIADIVRMSMLSKFHDRLVITRTLKNNSTSAV